MKDFSPFQAPVMTFFSAPFYKDLLRNGRGLGFAYLFLLLTLCWTMETVKVFVTLQSAMANKEVTELVNQVPAITLKNDKMSIDKPSPYVIKDISTGTPIILFDMSGKTMDLAHANGAKILVTQDFAIMEKSSGMEETLPWSKFKADFNFEKSMLNDILAKVPSVCTGIFWICGFVVWIGHLLLALMYGVAGLIMDSKKLGYAAMVRLAAFAMTPSILISTLLFLTGLDSKISFFGMVSVLITLGFMYFGNQSLKDEPPPLV